MTTIKAHPLQWPIGWKRTEPLARKQARFAKASQRMANGWTGRRDLTINDAVTRLLEELGLMGVERDDVVISTNVPTRLDGLPRSEKGQPGDPGAAVYWRKGKAHRVLAIDIYDRVHDNIAALAATIAAMRTVERHGGAVVLERAFTGFTALPAPIQASMHRDWQVVLELTDVLLPKREDVERAYRRLASIHHPDKGGSAERMAEINRAREEALAFVDGGKA